MAMDDRTARETILGKERGALDRWSSGDPAGYAKAAHEDVTYFDDIGAQSGVAGISSVRAYLSSLEGQIPRHSYEVVDPRIQLYGDIGIVTLRYSPSSPAGEALPPWKATTVYWYTEGDWYLVHANWSMIKDAQSG